MAECKLNNLSYNGFIFYFTISLLASGGDLLQPADVAEILEELLPAQNKSYELGLKFKLPRHELESINKQHSEPKMRLLQVIYHLLDQVEPPPTWRTIVDALRSPLVDLPQLAKSVEEAHLPVVSSTQETRAMKYADGNHSMFI